MDSAKNEIRDGMQIDWDVPIEMDDGIVLRADIYRPVGTGKISGHPELRPLRQRSVVPGRLQGQLGEADQGRARGSAELEQQISKLGTDRPGEMGAGRICSGARRLARRRALAGPPRRLVGARGAGSLRMRRMGRHARLEQRQSRHQRHLLLRHEPVAGRRTQAAASGRAVHLGRLVRLLPRALSPRRHPERLPQQLASAPGRERAARRRRPRRQERRDRRAGRRPANAVRGRTRQEPRRHARRGEAACAVRRLLR